jgi:uncharacterized YccA/Bax inhibitor family protein
VASSNPAFSQEIFKGYDQVYGVPRSTTMTVQGTVAKTFLLLAILSATALWAWNATASGEFPMALLGISAIGGFIVAMITIFRPTAAPWTAPIYAALEGTFLGALSQLIEASLVFRRGEMFHGIAMQAVILTCGVLFFMLFVYQTGLIRVTEKLKAGIVMATGTLCLFYLVTMLLSLFGVGMPLVFSSSPWGIGFSVLVVGLAAFNLLLDFDFIEQGAYYQAPKSMEWYGAFGLIVSLVWLYLETLRLLRKLADQR